MSVVHIDEISAWTGRELGVSAWVPIDQSRIDLFAQATGDFQWIHVDPLKAALGPFHATVAHGFLTLSMLPALIEGAVRFDGVQMSLNYGLNRVRFVSPVRVNSRLRLRLKLLEATPLDSGMQTTLEAILEIEGVLKPACVAEIVIRLLR